jgi:hypothetical protein
MERVVVAAVIILVVGIVALVARARRTADPPTQRRFHVPRQLDRGDFPRPDAPWLVAVFTSRTCDVCRAVLDKAAVLESDEVAVAHAEFGAAGDLHRRYGIEAVPTVVVCGPDGVTRAGFLGPMTATDLWAAVAEAREPGSTPEPQLGRDV